MFFQGNDVCFILSPAANFQASISQTARKEVGKYDLALCDQTFNTLPCMQWWLFNNGKKKIPCTDTTSLSQMTSFVSLF